MYMHVTQVIYNIHKFLKDWNKLKIANILNIYYCLDVLHALFHLIPMTSCQDKYCCCYYYSPFAEL